MNYFTDIDPIGESELENECRVCCTPCDGTYCSSACKYEDIQ